MLGAAAAAALIASSAGVASLTGSAAGAVTTRQGAGGSAYASLLAGHSYRHGVVPSREWLGSHPSASALLAGGNLTYHGGVAGVGVSDAPARIYLVFWGSQWGSQSVNGSGYDVYSGDPHAMAPDLQAFFKGLGTGGETWSGVMTQYCQGVASGATSCPASNASHVEYPTGGALAGVWEDASGLAPAAATAHQIGVEAVAAATHFGNTTQASNRNTQYVVVSPTGTDPDSYETNGFCAWHDYTGDGSLDGGGGVTSPDGLLAFTNLPYLVDVGGSCGEDFVNSGASGTLDGVSIVEGHEYAETITDEYPAGGWLDSVGNETGDKCAWISSGQGASQDISLTTGTFAVQSTWADDFNSGAGGCEVSHPIVSNPVVPAVSVVSPTSGPVAGGTAITITGTNFASPATVDVGSGTNAVAARSVVVVSSTKITAVTGSTSHTGSFGVYVTTSGGTSVFTSKAAFTYLARPAVTSLSPTSGPPTGGTTITVTGSNFASPATVVIGASPNSVACTKVSVVSATKITCVTGGNAKAGAWYLYVTTRGGTSAAANTGRFTYT